MIFSKLRKNMKERNYGSLALEFIVLVLGFFISLQVNEWQNDREHQEVESQYLERLSNDFEKSRVSLSENITRMTSSIDRLDEGLTILSNNKRTDEDYEKLFIALQSASMRGSFGVYYGTLEELKDTGYMRLIESTRLRENLGNLWQKQRSIAQISEIRNMLRGNTFPVIAKYVKPMEGNKITFDAQLVEENPRELYVAMSIIRANLQYDLSDSHELNELVMQALNTLREDTSD